MTGFGVALLLLILLGGQPYGALGLGKDGVVPPRRRTTTTTHRPRLARFTEHAVQLSLRGLLCAPTATTRCRIQAARNRDVWRGQWESLTVHVQEVRGPLWHGDGLYLQAGPLSLGKWPLVGLVGFPLGVWTLGKLLFWQSRSLWPWLALALYYHHYHPRRRQPGKAPDHWLPATWRRWLNGSPWALDYRLVLTQDNLQQSRAWQWILQSALRSLMLHSVLGVAAAVGDAWQDHPTTQRTRPHPARSANVVAPPRLAPSKLLLPAINAPQDDGTTLHRKGESSPSSSSSPAAASTNTPQTKRPPAAPWTQLLHATKFSLEQIRVAPNNHLLLDARASQATTTSFSYTLRVKLHVEEMAGPPQATPALVLGQPAICFHTNRLLPGAWKRLVVPDVFLPVGPGVALPLLGGGGRRRHDRPTTVCTTDDGRVEMSGRWWVFADDDSHADASPSSRFPRLPVRGLPSSPNETPT